jgi:hypothetical protein
MKIARFEVMEGSNLGRRLFGRIAVIALLGAAPIVALQSYASASTSSLSSIILANPLPGLVQLPLGTENGSITQSNVSLVLGSSESASSGLGQSLADGEVTAYIRTWAHQPSNGDALVITAFAFKYASDESSFMNGLDSQLGSQSAEAGNAAFAVAAIPGATGAEVHTSSSGVPLSEYVVSFVKGNTAFQEVVATTSGDLTAADAIEVANQQYAVLRTFRRVGRGRTGICCQPSLSSAFSCPLSSLWSGECGSIRWP